ncbi:MAG: hypothetical protein LM577_08380 [Thermoproteaceae archaeon]|nr:hypothetical protein [Thermoproteaceae archaeon]
MDSKTRIAQKALELAERGSSVIAVATSLARELKEPPAWCFVLLIAFGVLGLLISALLALV